MATADWYPDPTRADRLRYWDGVAWTDHVSVGDGMATETIAGTPPPPPRAAPAPGPPPEPEDPPPAPPDGPRLTYPPTLAGRGGLIAAAVGGALTTATVGSTAVTQDPFPGIEVTGGAWVGAIAAVLLVAAAAVRWPWARVTGVSVATAFAVFIGFAVIGFRTSDDLVPGVDVSLARAGWMMVASSLLLFAGVAVALAFLRAPVRAPDPAPAPGEGKGVAALVLGILGLFLPFLAGPAVALGLFAIDDVRASGGRVTGRGMAVAGLVLGIVSLALWAVGMLLGMLLAQP